MAAGFQDDAAVHHIRLPLTLMEPADFKEQ
jgi:hypothetical protein